MGLGNIWRFPYLTAQYGGGIFLLIYIVLVVTFGFSLMITEHALGRKTGLSVIGAYKALDRRFSFLGVLSAVVPLIIVPYYSVIGGWVLKYLEVYIVGQQQAAAEETFFSNFIGSTGEPILYLVIFLAVTFAIVIGGVEKGIEKANKFLMPALIVLLIIVAGYTCTPPRSAGRRCVYVQAGAFQFFC